MAISDIVDSVIEYAQKKVKDEIVKSEQRERDGGVSHRNDGPSSNPEAEIRRLRGVIREQDAEISQVKGRLERQRELSSRLVGDKADLQRSLAQAQSNLKAAQEPGVAHVAGSDQETIKRLETLLADAQQQQERDVAELERLRPLANEPYIVLSALQAHFNKLAKKPLPTSQATFARRLNAFAEIVGLDVPRKGKK